MQKTNYFAMIENKQGKRIAERRVYQEETSSYSWGKRKTREYVHFQKSLWNVDHLLDEGYTVYYRFVPSNYGTFGLLDMALSQPFRRTKHGD